MIRKSFSQLESESSLIKSQSRYQQLVKSHDARLTPLVAMLPPESAGMWLGDGLTRGKGAWLGDVRRKKGDPRRWARVRRESRPTPRTPLRCARPAMTQQGVVRGRSSGDLHVRHEHVNANGARAPVYEARASGGGATGWRPRSRGAKQAAMAYGLIHGFRQISPLWCEKGPFEHAVRVSGTQQLLVKSKP